MKTATRYAAPTAPPSKIVRPITIDSGMPSSTDPSTIASAGAVLLRAGPRPCASPPPDAVDEPVSAEEHHAAGEDAPIDRPVRVSPSSRLLDEIERDRADQHARAEGHDQPDPAHADVKHERQDGADHERRRRQRSPSEGRPHQPLAMRHRCAAAVASSRPAASKTVLKSFFMLTTVQPLGSPRRAPSPRRSCRQTRARRRRGGRAGEGTACPGAG